MRTPATPNGRRRPEQRVDDRPVEPPPPEDAGAVRDERGQVAALEEEEAGDDDEQADRDLDDTSVLVSQRRLLDAGDGHDGEHRDDGDRAEVDRRGLAEDRGRQVRTGSAGSPTSPARPPTAPEDELQQQVPADDPGHHLTDGGVGVAVGAARGRHGRRPARRSRGRRAG